MGCEHTPRPSSDAYPHTVRNCAEWLHNWSCNRVYDLMQCSLDPDKALPLRSRQPSKLRNMMCDRATPDHRWVNE